MNLTNSQRTILEILATNIEHGMGRGALVEILCKTGPYKMPIGTISSCLNRLEAYGLIDRPESPGGHWMINGDGMALLAGTADSTEKQAMDEQDESPPIRRPLITNEKKREEKAREDRYERATADRLPERASENDPATEPEPEPSFLESAAQTLAAMAGPLEMTVRPPKPTPQPQADKLPWDVEQALWDARARLSGKRGIPATTLYTYHALVEALPEPLRRELQPITESLELRE